ncbi:hypothetical protein SAMN05216371_6381 [Streptomyces sp. TLI_053]|uniref:hypothetical protein n=1 Tax=Streptomyces sp. TLI_053 TaxID=1855352 RepID=UPI0008799CDA|nr:hypothetical protein [Streptomyces sp. TLI_053]SDT80599.1 hypothetical protein SAMN05216371_6381 [Streptomyces sp. TLI_053]
MTEEREWEVAGVGPVGPVGPGAALAELRAMAAEGGFEAWLTNGSGRQLAVVSNTERVMVVLTEGAGDPGGHAVDPGAEGRSSGFVLTNGQYDEYPDEDTVPIGRALRIVEHILATGRPPADTLWSVDR